MTKLQFKLLFLSLLSVSFTGCTAEFNYGGAFASSFFYDCSSPDPLNFQGGNGTVSNPYVICSIDQFNLINTSPSYLSSNFVLGRSLDFTARPFNPIGNYDLVANSGNGFSGFFNGNNLTITNIVHSSPEADQSSGVFAYTSGATIRNLNLANNSFLGNTALSHLIGFGENTSVENIDISGGSILTNNSLGVSHNVGGIVGSMDYTNASSPYYIRNITMNADIQGDDKVGAIFGLINIVGNINFTFENIAVQSNITQAQSGNSNGGVGGIMASNGSNMNLAFRNISFNGNVTTGVGTGGSWCGIVFGQFYVSGGSNNTLNMTNVSGQGNLRSQANFNAMGSLGGIIGNLALNNLTASNITFDRLSSESSIFVLPNAITSNSAISGLFGRFSLNNSSSNNILISRSYSMLDIGSANSNQMQAVGGMIGVIDGSTTTNQDINIQSSYANITSTFSGFNPANSFGILGRFPTSGTVNLVPDSVYFNAPNSLAAGNQGAPTAYPGITRLDPTQSVLQSSYVGPLWNFTNTWSIQNGVSSPRLR